MVVDDYLNKTYITEDGNRYTATSVFQIGKDFVLLKSDTESFIKILFDIKNAKELIKQVDWLIGLNKEGKENARVKTFEYTLFPKERIINLKSSEIGFICCAPIGITLGKFINPSDRFTYNWYFNQTGGIYARLLLGYRIAIELKRLFDEGVYIGKINPDTIRIDPAGLSGKGSKKVQFVASECLSTIINPNSFFGYDLYFDPLVYKSQRTNSQLSDTYTYALILFEILTTCHPFKGEEYENLTEEDSIQKVNSGEMEYIGCSITQNYNEFFDEVGKDFIPQELAILFKKMFTVGKLSQSQRPNIEEFAQACLKGLHKLCTCSEVTCAHEFNCSLINTECPYCKKVNKPKFIKFYKDITSTNEILIPYGKFKKYTSLPTYRREIGYLVFNKNVAIVPWQFLDKSFPIDNGDVAVSFHLDPIMGELEISNRMKNIDLKIGKTYLRANNSRIISLEDLQSSPSEYRVIIPQIILIDEDRKSEEYCDAIELPHYGTTKIEYILEITE